VNNDTALILLLADLQRTIEAQRSEIARLTALVENGSPPDLPARHQEDT